MECGKISQLCDCHHWTIFHSMQAHSCICFTYMYGILALNSQTCKQLLIILIDRSQIQIRELMKLQLGESSSSLEDSSQMNIGIGYVLEHYLGFLFSSTFSSLQHWLFWTVSSSHFKFYSFSFMEMKFHNWQPSSFFTFGNQSALGDTKAVIADDESEGKRKKTSSEGLHICLLPYSFWFLFHQKFEHSDGKGHHNLWLILKRNCYMPDLFMNNYRYRYGSEKLFRNCWWFRSCTKERNGFALPTPFTCV